jgi:hypothetical protein
MRACECQIEQSLKISDNKGSANLALPNSNYIRFTICTGNKLMDVDWIKRQQKAALHCSNQYDMYRFHMPMLLFVWISTFWSTNFTKAGQLLMVLARSQVSVCLPDACTPEDPTICKSFKFDWLKPIAKVPYPSGSTRRKSPTSLVKVGQ